MKSHLFFALCLVLADCGAEDDTTHAGGFEPDQTCGLRGQLDGALVASFTGADTELACVTPIGSTGIHAIFVPLEGALEYFQLDASGIGRGATGQDFAAEVRLIARGEGREWRTDDCTVDITKHEYLRPGELGELYRVAGSGRCAASAPSVSGGDAPVTIGPFDFVVSVSWLGPG